MYVSMRHTLVLRNSNSPADSFTCHEKSTRNKAEKVEAKKKRVIWPE